jgi:hypothetical protein
MSNKGELEQWITNSIKMAERSLKKAPPGKLCLSRSGGKVQFYCRADATDKKGKYIRKKDTEVIRRLAQKTYDEKFVKTALQLLKLVQDKDCSVTEHCLMQVYDEMPDEMQHFVTPYIISDKQFVDMWLAREYDGKGFGEYDPDIYTEKGERVRSKSEKLIADKLYMLGIPYLYEAPLNLKGFGTVYPDFTLLDVEKREDIYYEHLGMMSDAEYSAKALRKIKVYGQNGYFPGDRLLISFEGSSDPVDIRLVTDMLKNRRLC